MTASIYSFFQDNLYTWYSASSWIITSESSGMAPIPLTHQWTDYVFRFLLCHVTSP